MSSSTFQVTTPIKFPIQIQNNGCNYIGWLKPMLILFGNEVNGCLNGGLKRFFRTGAPNLFQVAEPLERLSSFGRT